MSTIIKWKMLICSDQTKWLNVSVQLQQWDKSGKLKARRTPPNGCYYTEHQYLAYIGHADELKKHRRVACVLAMIGLSAKPQRFNHTACGVESSWSITSGRAN